MNNTLIILGMHRSGTSLTASWLHKCGLHLGDRLLGANEHNQNGHFEDRDFLDLHNETLTACGVELSGLTAPVDIRLNSYQLKKFEYLVRFKNSLRSQWGWKEPRTCLFSKIYHDLMPGAKYLIVFRDYPFVVDSLIRRGDKETDKWFNNFSILGKTRRYLLYRQKKSESELLVNPFLDGWCLYNEHLLELIRSISPSSYCLVTYQDLREKDVELFNKFTGEWNFNLDFHPFSSVYEPSFINEEPPSLIFNKQLIEKAESIKKAMLSLRSS